MTDLSKVPEGPELPRLYHELAALGARVEGRRSRWRFGHPAPEELVVLAAEAVDVEQVDAVAPTWGCQIAEESDRRVPSLERYCVPVRLRGQRGTAVDEQRGLDEIGLEKPLEQPNDVRFIPGRAAADGVRVESDARPRAGHGPVS